MIRGFDQAQLAAVIDHDNAYQAVRSALVKLAANQVSAPEEIALLVEPSGDVHVKGAHIQGSAWIVFKVASGSFPGAPNAGCSFVLDAATGAPTLLFDDGGWLTEMRTAAAGAIAADALANPGDLRVAILGTGMQARFQLEALQARRTVSAVNVWGRTGSKAAALAEEVGGTAFESVAQAVADVDIIVTSTSATSPILRAADLPAGVHITAMGSDTIGKRELADDVMERATIIAADDVPTCSRVGELQHRPNDIARAHSLAGIVAGLAPGRSNASDITIADLCGIGTYDAAIAGRAADLLTAIPR